MHEKTPVTNSYGLTFASEAEKEAWDAHIRERLEAARQTPTIAHEELKAQLLQRQKARRDVPHPLA